MFIGKKHGIIDPNQFAIPTNSSSSSYKPRILVVGSGWSAHAFIKIIDTDKFDVVCVSPRPYFVFTPMLPHAVVGNVEYRSIVEPIRAANPLVEYLEGEVVDIFPNENRCKVTSDLMPPSCTVPLDVYYDHIVFAVGARTGTFGVKGANEYCCFIKEVEDVKKLKSKIVKSFEAASLPGVPLEEIHRYLTFCIIGGGPTGSEYCAVLIDFLKSEIPLLYPRLVDKVKIVLLSSSEDILPTFDKSLRKKAMDNFRAFNVDLRLKSRVVRVDEKSVTYTCKDSDNPNVEISQPFGTCVWAAGVAPRAITTQLAERLGEPQISKVNKGGRLVVDKWLRVGGSNRVLSMGDCALVEEGNESKALPQTAQVAAQQGAYIARLFNRDFLYPFQEDNSPPRVNPVEFGGIKNLYLTSAVAKPFNFLNLGTEVFLQAMISINNI
jgi:NADH:ubiquinone reductase (non-electrogenic)